MNVNTHIFLNNVYFGLVAILGLGAQAEGFVGDASLVALVLFVLVAGLFALNYASPEGDSA